MKTQLLKFLMIALALSLGFVSCNKSTNLLEDELQPTHLPTMDDTFVPTGEESPSELIATIQKDGHEVKFYSTGSAENPGIYMEEALYGRALQNNESYHLAKHEEASNPFDVFVEMTDAEVSVPAAIAQSAKDDLLELSGRVVKKNSTSLELLDANYSEEEVNGTSRCANDVGYTNFKNWYCGSSHTWSIHHCGAGKRTGTLKRYSYFQGKWQYHQNTRVRVINCGSSTLYFYSWDGRDWRQDFSKSLGQGNRYRAHWISSRRPLRLIVVPSPGTQYRSVVNFVK